MKAQCPNCHHEFEVKSSKESDPRVLEVIKYYRSKFQSEYGSEPVIKWAACGTVAKRLLKDYGRDAVVGFIESYVSSQDKFFREAGLPFLLLPNFIQKQSVKQKAAWDGML